MIKMTKFAICLTSSIPQKTGPGCKFLDGVLYFGQIIQISNVFGKQIFGSLRRTFQLYMM